MNIGNVAVSAAPHLCRALRDFGMFPMDKQDFLDALKNHPKASAAIFWWCYAWHNGVGSDLYKVMCDDTLGYVPSPAWSKDPEIVDLIGRLDIKFGSLVQERGIDPATGEPYSYKPVKLADVKEGEVLIAGSHFPCIVNRWPCRVYRHHGALGVACSGSVHGVTLLPGSETTFHALTADAAGYVVGFRR